MTIANMPLIDHETATALVCLFIEAGKAGEHELAGELHAILTRCKLVKSTRAKAHRRPARKVWR